MIHYPNMVIVTGSGRNVGKTLLSCRIIEHLARYHSVIALKTSPHLHALSDNDHIIKQNRYFSLIEEKRITQKDSSRMLQAGATRSYYLQYEKTGIAALLDHLTPIFPKDSPVVCESGSLPEIIIPGAYICITPKKINSTTEPNSPVHERQIIIKPGHAERFNVKMFSFENDTINISGE